MYFALSDEQRALQDTVRSFLSARFGLAEVRAVYDDLAGDADPPRLWSSIAEQGWLAVLVPERYDGMGLGLLDAVVIARAFGAGMASCAAAAPAARLNLDHPVEARSDGRPSGSAIRSSTVHGCCEPVSAGRSPPDTSRWAATPARLPRAPVRRSRRDRP